MAVSRTRIIAARSRMLLRLWPATVAVRVVVAAILALGPASDEPSELTGWDAERFQAIAERDGPAWVDEPVEYPPGSVVVFDRLAGADVVATHRRLVGLSLLADLAVAAALAARVRADAARAYLVLGVPLVPLGYQRLDTLVTGVAVLGGLALLAATSASPRRGRGGGDGRAGRSATGLDALAGAALAVGALIKLWPAVLAVSALALGRWRAAATAALVGTATGVGWLLAVGAGLDPIDQVLSLRGATGWHIESLPGSLVALVTDARARLELNAFRVGTLRPSLVTAGRLAALALMAALAVAGGRATRSGDDPVRTLALTALGATSALVATAPLLSPQFLVWTTPWAALALAGSPPPDPTATAHVAGHDRAQRASSGRWHLAASTPALVAGGAGLLTGVTLTVYRPSGLDAAVPAALLTGRNLALLAVPALCLIALWPADPDRGVTGRTRGTGPAGGRLRPGGPTS